MRALVAAMVIGFFCQPVLSQSVKTDHTFFEKKIRPVLVENCYRCHSVEARKNKKLKGGLLLDSRDGLRKGGISGSALDPNKPMDSLLLKALRHQDDLEMPPGRKLPANVIADFEAWVAMGAPDPRDGLPTLKASPRDHWAFQPLRAVRPPAESDAWVRTPIDAFILEKLRAKGLTPSKRADARVLARRMSFDLRGLPPAPGEIDAAIASPTDADFDKLAETWLESPQFGERWAQHWLDVARYADSAGYSVDTARPTIYHYRDFVIKALNDDLPFDQFVRLQLAGDLVSPDGVHTATGFCTCGPFNTNSPKEIDRYDELDDLITTTGQAFLGLNLGCARCHNHKYDPVPQTEYYRMLAVFNSSQRSDRPIWTKAQAETERFKRIDQVVNSAEERELLRKAPDPANRKQQELFKKYKNLLTPAKIPNGHVLAEKPGVPVGVSYFLERGNIERKRDQLKAGFLGALIRSPDQENRWLSGGRVHPRRALADWLVDVEHGAGALTARVIVNRLWQHHFGVGLVRTPNDLGVQGDPPSHPELLDWLAGELIRANWRLRPIHRLILRSAAYRQASMFDAKKSALDRDNRLLWRFNTRRLDADAIRDSILTVSGGLDRTMYGPAVYPFIPKEAILPAAYTAWLNSDKDDPKTWRRSVYVFVKRSTPVPLFQAFDRPDRTISAGTRHLTTIVPQALHLINDPMIRTQAELFAKRVAAEAGTKRETQVRHAYRIALSRSPGPDEERLMLAFLNEGSLADLCQSILMLNEFVYVE